MRFLRVAKDKKEPWQIAAARFCVEKMEFTEDELRQFLEREYKVPHTHIQEFFENKIKKPSGYQYDRQHRLEDGKWLRTAPLELASTIVDFDEIKLARESASSAWRISMGALVVATIGSVFQVLSFFFG